MREESYASCQSIKTDCVCSSSKQRRVVSEWKVEE